MFKRFLNLHEYQSKQLMADFGINTQRFKVIEAASETTTAAQSLSTYDIKHHTDIFIFVDAEELVIKAQVLTGGRGKGRFTSGLKGGVQLTRDTGEASTLAAQMLGHHLITHQTTAEGLPVHRVMIAEAKDLARETYFAILLDRSTGGPVLVGSPKGGVDIEAVAATTPELVFKQPIALEAGPMPDQLRGFARQLGFSEAEGTLETAIDQMGRLWKLFKSVDATQIEINPFGVTPQGEVLCFDSKIEFDDNAVYRQTAIFNQADKSAEDVREVAAQTAGLNYIGMDGDIGCLVNGAGLAMATMDIIKMHGGSPANFLDVGGSASEAQIFAAMKLLNEDQRVRVILVNIFGGIMRCDVIAQGILKAYQAGLVTKPLVVRLNGTNCDLAMRMMEESDLGAQVRSDLDEAAQAAVSLLKPDIRALEYL